VQVVHGRVAARTTLVDHGRLAGLAESYEGGRHRFDGRSSSSTGSVRLHRPGPAQARVPGQPGGARGRHVGVRGGWWWWLAAGEFPRIGVS
jgi:hypothetical protein